MESTKHILHKKYNIYPTQHHKDHNEAFFRMYLHEAYPPD